MSVRGDRSSRLAPGPDFLQLRRKRLAAARVIAFAGAMTSAPRCKPRPFPSGFNCETHLPKHTPARRAPTVRETYERIDRWKSVFYRPPTEALSLRYVSRKDTRRPWQRVNSGNGTGLCPGHLPACPITPNQKKPEPVNTPNGRSS